MTLLRSRTTSELCIKSEMMNALIVCSFLYVLAAGSQNIDVLALNAPGKATQVQEFDFTAGAKQAKVTVNPNNVQGMSVFVA